MLIVLCYEYLIMHVHIVQSDFHVSQIPFRGDRSPQTALPHLVEPPFACSIPPRRGLASVGVGVLGAPDPAPEAVTNYYVTPPPPPGRQPFSKPRNAAP